MQESSTVQTCPNGQRSDRAGNIVILPKKILQQLRSHALIHVGSKHKGDRKRACKQAALERKQLWEDRYLVSNQEIQSCIQEGMMSDLIEDFHSTSTRRTGSFVLAYEQEWRRKAKLMAHDATILAEQLSTDDAKACLSKASSAAQNDDLISSFLTVCQQDTDWALRLVGEAPATKKGSKPMVQKALSKLETDISKAESEMKKLRDSKYGKALRKELADRHESIKIPASLKGLIEYLQKVPESQSAPSTTNAEPPAA